MKDKRILGLVIPHNYINQGAVNYKGESEYLFGRRIAEKLELSLAEIGIDSITIERNTDSYEEQCIQVAKICKNNKVAYSLHLHFNASVSGNATGCEVLIAATASKKDNILATEIAALLNSRYGFKKRGRSGVKTVQEGHSGYGMLSTIASIGTLPLIIEPCFGDSKNKESEFIFENEDKYVELLVDAIKYIRTKEDL